MTDLVRQMYDNLNIRDRLRAAEQRSEVSQLFLHCLKSDDSQQAESFIFLAVSLFLSSLGPLVDIST